MEYRINGFEQIKAFYSWVFKNPEKIRPTHISLYLFLLNQNNRSNWVEWFKCPYDLAMQGACIGNKGTYYRCLDELKEWKIIEYKKGINNFQAPLIKLIQLYKSEPLTEHITVPLSEPLTEQVTVPQSVPQTVPLSGHIYKLITDNIKLITDNKNEFEKLILNFIKEKKGKKNIFIPPIILEVENYFDENGYSKQAANKFFNYYSIAEWKDSKGNKVKNWKQKAQSVWFKDENKKINPQKPVFVC